MKDNLLVLNTNNLKERIYSIRNVQVMLDSNLAMLFEFSRSQIVTLKVSQTAIPNLKSQFVILKMWSQFVTTRSR